MTAVLFVTDLDGTLLDHETYSYEAAAPALAELRRRAIPLVLASSKTRVEMLEIHAALALSSPFICENGAAICSPTAGGLTVEALAQPRSAVLAVLEGLRAQRGYRFTGFADCDTAGIAAVTGLAPAAAALAAQREYSEPLIWEDSVERLESFRRDVESHGLTAQQGGRFLSIAGPADKGRALEKLKTRYPGARPPRVVALGDSPNDVSMLEVADIAVIIKSGRSQAIHLEGPQRVLRTVESGPAGWRQAVLELLATDLAQSR